MEESPRVIHLFQRVGTDRLKMESERIIRNLPEELKGIVLKFGMEYCYNIELENKLAGSEKEKLLWMLQESPDEKISHVTSFSLNSGASTDRTDLIVEVGPRLTFCTAWNTNFLSMLYACGVNDIKRIERSRRFQFSLLSPQLSDLQKEAILFVLHDRMTENIYDSPLISFATSTTIRPVHYIPVMLEGSKALATVNNTMGLGLDEADIAYYSNLFINMLHRDPTDMEMFDIGQSNSEHSRHWLFGGKIFIDGIEQNESLFQIIMSTLARSAASPVLPRDLSQPIQRDSNSIIAFYDNSSAIRGFTANILQPTNPVAASEMKINQRLLHPILTAETHNFPTGVAPYAGAETGTGGRIRDIQATGRGAYSLAGICGYCVGNLHMPDIPSEYHPWEQPLKTCNSNISAPLKLEHFPQFPVEYPSNLASPLCILIEGSNGASDYGNKYGEPVVAGFTRSFGLQIPSYITALHHQSQSIIPPSGSIDSISATNMMDASKFMRVEWLKPVMFTAGVGWLDDIHKAKDTVEKDMLVCKMGGPAYRIGMGGGAASSRIHQGLERISDSFNFNAVQRGDAEMENRMNRLVRGCIELGKRNPILSIHDQGAGGNGNVLKELVDPLGAHIQLRNFPSGDPTLSALEIWGAEYQENNAFLVNPGGQGWDLVKCIADRENCPVAIVGVVSGDGCVKVEAENGRLIFDLPLSQVLGKMPQKIHHFKSPLTLCVPLHLPTGVLFSNALARVFHLVDVGSKRFLTNKVDRSVSGLVAQQQCVGPLHTPVADVAVLAQSYFETTGVAVAVGEQPIKGLIDPASQARMTVCEALSNLVFADITELADVKASCNWMWPAKLIESMIWNNHTTSQGEISERVNVEGARMYAACLSLRRCLLQLGVSIDGGKDSLTMAAKMKDEIVRCPGEITMTCYAPCRDITNTITPDLKFPGEGVLLYIDMGEGKYRLGGTSLSTVYQQLGDVPPDMSDNALNNFRNCFDCLQKCIQSGLIQSGHDRSDGGLITTILEMAFAGNVGVNVTLREEWTSQTVNTSEGPPIPTEISVAFGEEVGFVLEVLPAHVSVVLKHFSIMGVLVHTLGRVGSDSRVLVLYERLSGECTPLLDASVAEWRDVWEETSFALERRQCNKDCVKQESEGLKYRSAPPFHLTFTPSHSHDLVSSDSTASEKSERKVRAEYFQTPLKIPRLHTQTQSRKFRIAVLRQEGTNGDREMIAAFYSVGFEAWDVNMNDLLRGQIDLTTFRGIAFCGGFSYADVNGSAKGWAAVIRFHSELVDQFNDFHQRVDTFSLGVCNGCQLMALLGWVPCLPDFTTRVGLAPVAATKTSPIGGNRSGGIKSSSGVDTGSFRVAGQVKFSTNLSGRFESRWSAVKVLDSPSVLLQGMEGSVLGIWTAHGEGRAQFSDPGVQQAVVDHGLAPVRYVDDEGEITERYPFNPNGSPLGIAALCSTSGRHLAIMPHPERTFLKWQIPYESKTAKERWSSAPWLKLFQNAHSFCEEN